MGGKIFNFLPVFGGSVGGGLGVWVNSNHDMLLAAIVSAVIFAVVGGVVGYLVQHILKWISKEIKMFFNL